MAEGAPPRRNVAIFVDMENLFGGYGRDVTSVAIGPVIREIECIIREHDVGSLTATVRAYANWGRADMAAYRREMLENGVEPVQVFSFGKDVKNAADIELCVDVLEVAHESPWVDVFVIVSGDGGFVPLIRRLHFLDKYAIVVSTNHANAGASNRLLESVADEYHVVDVSGRVATSASSSSETTGLPQLKPKQPTKTAREPKKTNVQPDVVPIDRVPTVEEYHQSVKALLSENPGLVVEGAVNGSALGPLLRKRWPMVDYSTFGYRTFGAFIEDYCKLRILRQAPASAGFPRAVISEDAQVTLVHDRESYIEAVRQLFAERGVLSKDIRDRRDAGMSLSDVGLRLRSLISGKTHAEVGYPKLLLMLQNALSVTSFRIVKREKDIAVMHAEFLNSLSTYPLLPDEELDAPEVVRAVLAAREPKITYPEPMIISEIMEVVIRVRQPLEVADFIDLVADEVPDLPAERIRLSLGLLTSVGVLEKEKEGERLLVTPEVESVEDGLGLVVADGVRRAEEIAWPVTGETLEYILY